MNGALTRRAGARGGRLTPRASEPCGAGRAGRERDRDAESHAEEQPVTVDQQPPATPVPETQPDRRSAERDIALALDLGWRVAAVHALRPTKLKTLAPAGSDMLPNRRSLSPADRLELEVQAIGGIAAAAGAPVDVDEMRALVALALAAADSTAAETAFRDAIAERHVAFAKQLWMTDEARGKAYELGNFLSDTWNRTLRPGEDRDAQSELLDIFSPLRVERMKLLLDDLQARVDPVAAHTVNTHLDEWSARVHQEPVEPGRSLEPIERQTIIWRQMLTGDKEPEAYIGRARRAEVRDELNKQLWKRYRSLIWLLPLLAILGGLLGFAYVDHPDVAKSLSGSLIAVAGALGITRASMTGTVRRGVQGWSELMWNRALAVVICRETSLLREVFPEPEKRGRASSRRARRG
ncbi:MAG: hypothetical protein QOG56_2553 [Solirubrobacteraceae bacterium]|nr:hypothetical protein [Solirubrobacteraceae bacterium]